MLLTSFKGILMSSGRCLAYSRYQMSDTMWARQSTGYIYVIVTARYLGHKNQFYEEEKKDLEIFLI